jgi:hypothetical protein
MRNRIVIAMFVMAIAFPVTAQTTDAMFPAAVGRMYAASTAQTWIDVLKLLKDTGFKTEVKDDTGRFLVTQPEPVDAKRFGFALTDVVPNASAGRVKLHVFVPKFIEPARVYVGSTLTADVATSGGRRQVLVYSPDVFGVWLHAKLSATLSLTAHQIPQSPARRATLAKKLLGASDDKCLTRIENGPQTVPDKGNWMAPRKMHEVPVVYPRSGEVNRLERKLLVNAVIGEDGFAWPIGVTTGPPTDDFSMTVLGSIPLWRFAPLMIEGCPAPMPNATVGLSFVFR